MVTVMRMSLPSDNTARPENAGKPAGGPHCFARSVVDTLAEETALEAVTIDPARQKISVATLGRADVDKLTQRLTDKFQTAQKAVSRPWLHAAAGQRGLRRAAATPLSEAEQKISIQQHGAEHDHRARHLSDRAEILALARHAVPATSSRATMEIARGRRSRACGRMEMATGRWHCCAACSGWRRHFLPALQRLIRGLCA